MTLIEKADALAQRAHAGQTRKVGGEPYISHPRAVANLLRAGGFDDTTIAAALVHDVLEDTNVTEEEVRRELGDAVARIVSALTEDKSLPWEERKRRYIESLRNGPEGAKAISTADKIHNALSLLDSYEREGNAVWSGFNRGKKEKLWFEEEMLSMLKEAWHHPLVDEYAALIEQIKKLD